MQVPSPITSGCESVSASQECIAFLNETKQTVNLVGVSNGQVYLGLPAGQLSYATIQQGERDGLKMIGKDKTDYGYLPNNQSYVVIFPKDGLRTMQSRVRRVFLMPIGIVLIMLAIVCGVMSSKVKANNQLAYCQTQNLGESDDFGDSQDSECGDMEALKGFPAKNGGYIAGAVIFALLGLACIALWMWAFGPFSWCSYSKCKAKNGYGSTWKWVMPRSGFRKFLCQAFGACECASDILQASCAAMGASAGEGFKWNEIRAAKSTSKTSICFCCAKEGSGTCIDQLTNSVCTS